MFKILQRIQKNLIIAVPVVMAAGIIFGLLFENVSFLQNLVLPFTFLMVYPMMVTVQLKKIVAKGDFKLQLLTQLINFAIIPFIAFFIGKIFFGGNPYFSLGILLVALLPTSGMTISWTGMSKGNVEAAVKMTVFGLIIGSLLTPFYIKALLGAEISIPLTKIFTQIAIIVVAPLLAGWLTQTLIIKRVGAVKYNSDVKKIFPPISTLGVLAIVFVAMALKAKSIASDPLKFVSLIPPLLILYFINLVISTFAAKRFFNKEDGLALVYGTVLRNLSIALAIAMTTFGREGADIALIIALGYIIQIQLSSWYVKLSPVIFSEKKSAANT